MYLGTYTAHTTRAQVLMNPFFRFVGLHKGVRSNYGIVILTVLVGAYK